MCKQLINDAKNNSYPMEKRTLSSKKNQIYEIKRLNKKYNIEMLSRNIRGRKAFAAQQKIRAFEELI